MEFDRESIKNSKHYKFVVSAYIAHAFVAFVIPLICGLNPAPIGNYWAFLFDWFFLMLELVGTVVAGVLSLYAKDYILLGLASYCLYLIWVLFCQSINLGHSMMLAFIHTTSIFLLLSAYPIGVMVFFLISVWSLKKGRWVHLWTRFDK